MWIQITSCEVWSLCERVERIEYAGQWGRRSGAFRVHVIKSDVYMNTEELQRDGEIGELKVQEGSSLDFTHSRSPLVSSHVMALFSDVFSFLRRASREFQVPGLLELAPPSREKQRSEDIVIHNISFLSDISFLNVSFGRALS